MPSGVQTSEQMEKLLALVLSPDSLPRISFCGMVNKSHSACQLRFKCALYPCT